jgi:transcriptional regulator with XRE-family HTH domain
MSCALHGQMVLTCAARSRHTLSVRRKAQSLPRRQPSAGLPPQPFKPAPSALVPRRTPGTSGRRPPNYPDLNFQAIGAALGISPTHVGRILNGVSRPSMRVAERLAVLMGWSIDQINKLYNRKQAVQALPSALSEENQNAKNRKDRAIAAALSGLSPASRRIYGSRIKQWIDWAESRAVVLDTEHIKNYMRYLELRGCSAHVRNQSLAALKRLAIEAAELGWIEHDAAIQIQRMGQADRGYPH